MKKTPTVSQLEFIFSVINEGDEPNCVYFLVSGVLAVLTGQNQLVAKLTGFRAFGEKALESDSKRSASIKADTDVQTLVLYKADYDQIIKATKFNELKVIE